MQTLSPPLSLKRPTLKQPVPQKVVALGDSLIYGFGDPDGGGWVERLRRQWLSPYISGPILYNLGVRGDTVSHVSNRLAQEFLSRGELRHRVPDWMFLSVGINDSPRLGRPEGRNMTSLSSFQVQIDSLLAQASKLAPILFIGTPPVDETQMPFANAFYYNHADQYQYKEMTRLACQTYNIPYLDLFELWQKRGTAWCQQHLCRDGLHPNAQGYQAILEEVSAWHPFQALAQISPMIQAA